MTLRLLPVHLANSYLSFTSHPTHYFLQEGIPEHILQAGVEVSSGFPGSDLPFGLVVHSPSPGAVIAGAGGPGAELSLQQGPKGGRVW